MTNATQAVYERRPDWGGKARSQPVPGSAIGARKPLPASIAFASIRVSISNVIHLMQRIPFMDNDDHP